jgi:hypothetical protein
LKKRTILSVSDQMGRLPDLRGLVGTQGSIL